MLGPGDLVPDLTFDVAPGQTRPLSELCPGVSLLVFLRHLA
ncbi:MAG: hypothetical protein AB7I30_24405 [Isosphaeraceae bacterium]